MKKLFEVNFEGRIFVIAEDAEDAEGAIEDFDISDFPCFEVNATQIYRLTGLHKQDEHAQVFDADENDFVRTTAKEFLLGEEADQPNVISHKELEENGQQRFDLGDAQ